MARLGLLALHFSAASALAEPVVETPLGRAVGSVAAEGVERFGGLPYAVPPLGPRRFGRAEVNHAPWEGGELDARKPGAPCIQNPLADPRSPESESPAPSEDCLKLNIWRPAAKEAKKGLLPVMVYLFGGGLCSGFAGNEYQNGSSLALKHDVLLVTVQYRLGALGFLVAEDKSRPGTGGMNGLHDSIAALQWLQSYVGAFGGDKGDITLFGQSSGGYSTCALSVAPAAKGLFKRASLLSGPCLGGPPHEGWGPMSAAFGKAVTAQVLKAHNATGLDDLRKLPAEKVQWPDEWMNDPAKAPYFSGYFEDEAVIPRPTEEMWKSGDINPKELMVQYTSKDGTAAFYGTAPTLGRVPPDVNSSTAAGFAEKMRKAWGPHAERVMEQYPLSAYPSPSSAFIQADADAFIVCPSRHIVRYAVNAGRRTWVSEFAHFQPSQHPPAGCDGYGTFGCLGFGCDNGVELDVVPGFHAPETQQWATHGSDYRYIFGTTRGPDGIGPPNNVTDCSFSAPEQELSEVMMAHWVAFARHGDPNTAADLEHWPEARSTDKGVEVMRMRFAVEETDGVPTSLVQGMRDANCDFWDSLFSGEERSLVI